MAARCSILVLCVLLLSCESPTAPETDDWRFVPGPHQSLLSSQVVKTILEKDGTLYSWGVGFEGTLGQGNLKSLDQPTKVKDLKRVIDYVQFEGYAYALTESGDLYFWGHSSFSSIFRDPILRPTRATRVPGGVSLGVSWLGVHIIDAEGGLWFVEPNLSHPSRTPSPQRVPLSKPVAKTSGTLGLFADGTLFALHEFPPEQGGLVGEIPDIVDFVNLSGGRTMALKEDGTVWMWGRFYDPDLPDPPFLDVPVPTPIPGLTDVRRISMSGNIHMVIKDDGTVWYWGYRGRSESDERLFQRTPAQVPGIEEAVDVGPDREALIRTADGSVFVFHTNSLKVERVPGW